MKIAVYCYDHINNPRCGGGGAYRTLIIHRMLAQRHTIAMYFGSFTSATRCVDNGATINFLGFGKSYLVSRITFAIHATIHSLFHNTDLAIVEFSVFSPVFTFLFRPKSTIIQLHHLIGKEPVRKYGIPGILPIIAEKIMLRFTKYMVTSADSVATLVQQKHPYITARATYNGIDDAIYSTAPGDKQYILSLGRLDVYMKGLDVLLDAFDRIAGEFPAHSLVIAGRGNEKDIDRLQKRIAASPWHERIKLFLNIANDRKIDLLRHATFGCMPSRFEGWNIVAIETAASSKATLGTDIYGLKDTIKNGETGILVPPGDAVTLAKKMALLLSDAALRELFGKNGYAWAKTFSWEKVTERQEAFYQEVAKKGRR
jgi:glycosyltransferase involved in cell wall biosynthesis